MGVIKKLSIISLVLIVIVLAGSLTAAVWIVRHFPLSEQAAIEDGQPANAASSAQRRILRPISSSDYYQGNLAAPVQLIFYGDFECGGCLSFYAEVEKAVEHFGADNLAVAFRHYPLASHAYSEKAALAAECAGAAGKFWEVFDSLFALGAKENFGQSALEKLAGDQGIDQVEFLKCVDSGRYKDKVQADLLEVRSLGGQGTPTFFINGLIFHGSYPWADFTDDQGRPLKGLQSLIADALAAELK